MKSPPDPLDPLLATWQVHPPRTPEFRRQVWARIQAVGTPATWPGYVRLHAGVIVGALAVAVMLGALGGRSQARARVAAESEQLASAYVQGLDARSMRMP